MQRCTFDSFVVCGGSRAAFQAAVDVAEGRAGEALFLVGPTGSGKTHLLHAVANHLRSRKPGARVLHVPAQVLAWQLYAAIRDDNVPAFRRSLAAFDAILADDVYLPSLTLGEIVHIAQELARNGVRVIFAADVPARRWPGAIVEIAWPDEPARREMARRLAAARGIGLSKRTLRRLARRVAGNPRKLESAVTTIAAGALTARLSGGGPRRRGTRSTG